MMEYREGGLERQILFTEHDLDLSGSQFYQAASWTREPVHENPQPGDEEEEEEIALVRNMRFHLDSIELIHLGLGIRLRL